jgi:hypothetical protein
MKADEGVRRIGLTRFMMAPYPGKARELEPPNEVERRPRELDAIRQMLSFETRVSAEPPEAEVGIDGCRVHPQSLCAGRTRLPDQPR